MGYSLPLQFLGKMDNVTSNGQANFRLPIGARLYQEIYVVGLTSAGVPVSAAQLSGEVSGKLRLAADNVDLYRVTIADLHMLQQYYGGGVASIQGACPLGIERQSLRSAMGEAELGLGTANVKDLRLEIGVGTLTNVASIAVYAKVNNVAAPLGFHRRLLTTSRTYSVSGGDFEDTELPVFGADATAAYLAMHVPDSNGYLANATIRVNQFPVIDRIPPTLLHQVAREDRRVPQSGVVHIPFDLADLANGSLNLAGANDFKFEGTTVGGALGTVDVLTETLHNIPEKYR